MDRKATGAAAMTSEQRIAEWAEKLADEVWACAAPTLMAERIIPAAKALIASVRAEAIEECAKVCEGLRYGGAAPKRDGFLGACDSAEVDGHRLGQLRCAESIRALAKERKG